MTNALKDLCQVMDIYHERTKTFPATLNDPLLIEIEFELDTNSFTETVAANGCSYSYFRGKNPKIPSFEVCVYNVSQEILDPYLLAPSQKYGNPLDLFLQSKYGDAANGYPWILCINQNCDEQGVTLYASYDDYRKRTPLSDPTIALGRVPINLLSTTTKLLVGAYEERPDDIRQERIRLSSGGAASVLTALDTDADDAISGSEILDSSPVVAFLLTVTPGWDFVARTPPIPISELSGDPAYLFSYEALARLSQHYSEEPGVGHSLAAKAYAAEAAEAAGNDAARRGSLRSYQNELDAQTGKAISEDDARTLRALLFTF